MPLKTAVTAKSRRTELMTAAMPRVASPPMMIEQAAATTHRAATTSTTRWWRGLTPDVR
jgi:hypothetical protein